ncbi:MAG TPA: SDR family NAD(P)-dependent oxidoreductase, partial [Gemmataceae bacterium]|nr:SDR family NAD(P)-dependent oxidoreductase [Gemmataceae bacterium]
MNIQGRVALVTGGGSGIGESTALELARRGAKKVIVVDRGEHGETAAGKINERVARPVAEAFIGDVTDDSFRTRVFDEVTSRHGPVSICVPAAGITRDALAVKIDKETDKASIYPIDQFRQVTEINLVAPVYWSLEVVARVAEDRKRGGLG